MGFRRFIFCFCSVAILATTTLPNAHAGPYDKEIEDLQKQIDEVNSDIDDIKNDVKTEEQKIVDLQNELPGWLLINSYEFAKPKAKEAC